MSLIRKVKHSLRYRTRTVLRLAHGSKWVVAGAIIFREDGKLLLIRHRWRRAWEYPVGAVDGTESPLEAAKREVQEEVGLKPTGYKLLGVDFFERGTPNGNLVFTFAAHIADDKLGDLKIDRLEATDHKWADRAEAMQLISPRFKNRLGELLKAYDAGLSVYLEGGDQVRE